MEQGQAKRGAKSEPSSSQDPDSAQHHDFDDHRKPGQWNSIYPSQAWYQIGFEFIYLILVMALGVFLLMKGSQWHEELQANETDAIALFFTVQMSSESIKWGALATAGALGGTVFDLKWLYHAVANCKWHRDRIIWRVIVPFNSALVSLFTGFLFTSGVIPFIISDSFSGMYTLLGLGFVFGYFSDGILAALQRLAYHLFGTLKDSD
ncbi:hypothetical protein [Histidinibacterium aquaticum]|uniref:Uncharacterized protein n=1 Tax=Histidinibacterium aquaticum TaxID=2613962 RepID=A0A5J5GKE0_9RHOB|nr:hypothetical protein [Histidinibacterium aquaticum]KAA9008098.1 hypothetical protein F3S47_11365 [Histidinibacterium aquaticum]